MIKALIFDCFGVLCKDPTLLFYERHIPQFEHHREELANLEKQYDYGYISLDERARQIADISGLSPEFIIENLRDTNTRNEELLEQVRTLGQDYKIGMLSNIGAGGVDSLFTKSEKDKLFDVIVLSYEEGIIKPDEEIFRRTATKLDCLPSECIMIDDREENCAGAKRAGMSSILYHTNQQAYRELEELLKASNHARAA